MTNTNNTTCVFLLAFAFLFISPSAPIKILPSPNLAESTELRVVHANSLSFTKSFTIEPPPDNDNDSDLITYFDMKVYNSDVKSSNIFLLAPTSNEDFCISLCIGKQTGCVEGCKFFLQINPLSLSSFTLIWITIGYSLLVNKLVRVARVVVVATSGQDDCT